MVVIAASWAIPKWWTQMTGSIIKVKQLKNLRYIINLINFLIFFSGAGESGKSTIVKQMRILHVPDGFTKE